MKKVLLRYDVDNREIEIVYRITSDITIQFPSYNQMLEYWKCVAVYKDKRKFIFFYDDVEIHDTYVDIVNDIKNTTSYKKYKRIDKLNRILEDE